nr:hypothetical protein CFP56_45121 [Quercus suber]
MVGESSKPPMESTVTSALPEAPTASGSLIPSSDQASELLAPIPSRVIGDPMAGKAMTACSSSDAVVLASIKAGFSMGSVSDVERQLWFKIIFLLSLTWVMVEDEFVEWDDHGKDQRCHHHVHMTQQRSVGFVGNFSQLLGFTSFRGSQVKGLTIVVKMERKIFVCWSVTLCLDGNPMFSVRWWWFRTPQRNSSDGFRTTIELGVPIDEKFMQHGGVPYCETRSSMSGSVSPFGTRVSQDLHADDPRRSHLNTDAHADALDDQHMIHFGRKRT